MVHTRYSLSETFFFFFGRCLCVPGQLMVVTVNCVCQSSRCLGLSKSAHWAVKSLLMHLLLRAVPGRSDLFLNWLLVLTRAGSMGQSCVSHPV